MADPMEILRRLQNDNPTMSTAQISTLWMAEIQEDEAAAEALFRTFDDMLVFDPQRAKRVIAKGDLESLTALLKDMQRH